MELGAYKKRTTTSVDKDGHPITKQEPGIVMKKGSTGDAAGEMMVDSSIVTDLYQRLKAELSRKNTSRNSSNGSSGSGSNAKRYSSIGQGLSSAAATTTTGSPTTSLRSRRYRTSHLQEHHRTIRDVNRDYGVVGGGGVTLDSSQLEGGDIPVTEEVTIESTSVDASSVGDAAAVTEVARPLYPITNIVKNANRLFDVEQIADGAGEIRTGPTTIINNTANLKRLYSDIGENDVGRLRKQQDGVEDHAMQMANAHHVDQGSGGVSFKAKRIKSESVNNDSDDVGGEALVDASIIDQIIEKSETAVKDLSHDQMEASHVLLSLNNET